MIKVEGLERPCGVLTAGRAMGAWTRHGRSHVQECSFKSVCFMGSKRADGGSRSHALKVSLSMAQVLHDVQDKSVESKLKRPLAESAASGQGVGDDFQINDNIFDESRLWIRRKRGGRKRQHSILALATQVTRQAAGCPGVKETDITRTFALLNRFTAAHCAGVLARPDECTG